MADFSRFTGVTETVEVARQVNAEPQLRPQPEQEREPTYYRRELEREGWSEWSGGSWGGRTR
jgi:hypothetical protein